MHGFGKKSNYLGIRNGKWPAKANLQKIRPLKARHGVVVQCSDPLRSRGWRELFEFEKAVNCRVLGWGFKIESHYIYLYIYPMIYIYIPLLYPITYIIVYIYNGIMNFNVTRTPREAGTVLPNRLNRQPWPRYISLSRFFQLGSRILQ